MRTELENIELDDVGQELEEDGGGLLGLALFALAVGAGAALMFAPAEGGRTRRIVGERIKGLRGDAEVAFGRVQREFRRREAKRRRQRRSSALMGLAVGAGLATLLTPESGPVVRRRISERLRRTDETSPAAERVVREPQPDPEPAA